MEVWVDPKVTEIIGIYFLEGYENENGYHLSFLSYHWLDGNRIINS